MECFTKIGKLASVIVTFVVERADSDTQLPNRILDRPHTGYFATIQKWYHIPWGMFGTATR
jgi:hypothetical protein